MARKESHVIRTAIAALAAVATVAVIAGGTARDAEARIIRVNWDGTGDYPSIKAAVLSAAEGDTIRVAPGTYSGSSNTDIDTAGMNLVFESDDDPDATIIDGEGLHGAFLIDSGQDSTYVVRGFTFLDCHRNQSGGAFVVQHSSPIIEYCRFQDCTASFNGGSVYANDSSAIVRRCVFHGNAAEIIGGALYGNSSALTISWCLFDDNSALGGYGGGAVYSSRSADYFTNCTFTENVTDAVVVFSGPDFRMTDCIVTGTIDGAAVVDQEDDGTDIRHCVIFDNAAGDSLADHHHDNLFLDPLFCDAQAYDYTHCLDSECLPDFNDWGELIGAYGEGCGPCNTPVEDASWGVLKALFRQ
jgi:hypothetical protein